MNDIKKIKIELHKIITEKFENLSPYLIPEFIILIKDPITNEQSITFQYFNDEETVEMKLKSGLSIDYGKTTGKILNIKNFEFNDFKKQFSENKNEKLSNFEIVLKILTVYLP